MNDRRWTILALLCIAQLMVILDISAVNVALPNLANDLSIAPGDLSWTVTSYSLVFGSLLLLGGRAADLLGRRRVFLTGLTLFTAASLASGLATTEAMLFASRAAQGLGAAMLSPAALSIITSVFTDGHERARALSAWGAIGGAGAAIGVLLGGVLTQLVDWRAIFFINLPVGIALAAAARAIVPTYRAASQDRRQLDFRGALLATAGIGSLVFAFSRAASVGWISLQTLGVGAAGIATLATFALLERRVKLPLLRVERLADRAIGGGFTMMLAGSAVLFGSFLLASLYLQQVLGANALETGLAFVPFALSTGAGVHLGTHIVTRRGVRAALTAGFAVVAGGMLLLTRVSAHGSYAADLLPGMLIAGLGLGTVLVSVGVSVLAGAREHESGMLSGLNTTGHEVGGSLGLAILTTVATGASSDGGAIAATGLADAFLVAAAIAAAASILAAVILPSAKSFLPKLATAQPMPIH
jgi:EmrB/QacA subfamily drug resistance transporter